MAGLDQYGAEPYEQQQFGTAGVEGVKSCTLLVSRSPGPPTSTSLALRHSSLSSIVGLYIPVEFRRRHCRPNQLYYPRLQRTKVMERAPRNRLIY